MASLCAGGGGGVDPLVGSPVALGKQPLLSGVRPVRPTGWGEGRRGSGRWGRARPLGWPGMTPLAGGGGGGTEAWSPGGGTMQSGPRFQQAPRPRGDGPWAAGPPRRRPPGSPGRNPSLSSAGFRHRGGLFLLGPACRRHGDSRPGRSSSHLGPGPHTWSAPGCGGRGLAPLPPPRPHPAGDPAFWEAPGVSSDLC